jgi:hypothetical protein
MTIVIPKPNLIDRLLRILGKRRGVALRVEGIDPNGTQSYYAPKKESVLRALLRPSGRCLSDQMIDIFTFQMDNENIEEKTQKQVWMPFDPSGLTAQELSAAVRDR